MFAAMFRALSRFGWRVLSPIIMGALAWLSETLVDGVSWAIVNLFEAIWPVMLSLVNAIPAPPAVNWTDWPAMGLTLMRVWEIDTALGILIAAAMVRMLVYVGSLGRI